MSVEIAWVERLLPFAFTFAATSFVSRRLRSDVEALCLRRSLLGVPRLSQARRYDRLRLLSLDLLGCSGACGLALALVQLQHALHGGRRDVWARIRAAAADSASSLASGAASQAAS